jgi:hypothetical protein
VRTTDNRVSATWCARRTLQAGSSETITPSPAQRQQGFGDLRRVAVQAAAVAQLGHVQLAQLPIAGLGASGDPRDRELAAYSGFVQPCKTR